MSSEIYTLEQMPERLERTTIYESEHVCLYTDNGMSDAIVHVFVAQVSTENKIYDTDEVSSKKWFTEKEYLDLLGTNATKDGVSMLAVLYALQF